MSLFENMTFHKKVNYLFRNMIFSFENMTFNTKVNYLLRKYDLFIQEYAKATLKWDELTFVECFLGKQLDK
mgnify:CR=1 FL=1